MRHRKAGRKLGMDASERKAMFRNMVTSLLLHGRIRTTEARAKELRPVAERVLSLGKRAPATEGLEGEALRQAQADRVHLIRRARLFVHDDVAMGKLFGEYASRFASRAGGYTRILKAGKRPGDHASMAYIELVDQPAPVAVEAEPAAEPAPTT